MYCIDYKWSSAMGTSTLVAGWHFRGNVRECEWGREKWVSGVSWYGTGMVGGRVEVAGMRECEVKVSGWV